MARYDKYDPISGGFRAKLNANLTLTAGEIGPVGVSINSSGRVLVGNTGASGTIGVLCKNAARGPIGKNSLNLTGASFPELSPGAMAGDAVDVMTAGEIVGVPTFTAGQVIYALAAGTLSATPATGAVKIGFMAEAGRLIVRCAAGAVITP